MGTLIFSIALAFAQIGKLGEHYADLAKVAFKSSEDLVAKEGVSQVGSSSISGQLALTC
jgi:hypothetical protein